MKPDMDRDCRRPVSWVHVGCGVFVLLWLSVGAATSIMLAVPSEVKVAVLGGWVLLAASRSWSFFSTMAINAWPLVAMLLISVAFGHEVRQSDQYTQGFGYLLISFALLSFYSQLQFRREGHILMGVMAADFMITGVRTFVALQSDPLLSRYLATTEENRAEVYGNQSFAGLGGYGYAYSLAAIVLVLLYFAIRSPFMRIPLAFICVGGMAILVELGYTTAILLTFVLGSVFLIRDLVGRREVRLVIYAGLLLGLMTGLYLRLLHYTSSRSWVPAEVGKRLSELSRFLSGETTRGTDLGARFGHWADSLGIVAHSGPFGLSGQRVSSHSVGGHSQWLDLLASYGLSALFLAAFLVLAWRLSVRQTPVQASEPLKRAWIYFLLLGLVNTSLFSTIVLTWMFFLPSLINWLSAKSHDRHSALLVGVVG